MFVIRDREAGNEIEKFATMQEAEEALKRFEEEDKAEGIYTEDFYEIKSDIGARVHAMRTRAQLSAQKFGDYYGIPLRTIQDWEREVRTAPEYVINLLERAVNEDFPRATKGDLDE